MKIAVILASMPLLAAPPLLTTLEPWGAQRGKAFVLTLGGNGLMAGAKIVTTLPATFTLMAPPAEAAGRKLPFLVELAADASVGLYPVRIESPNGISNVLLFSVGAFEEVREAESESRSIGGLNDAPATAESVKQTPVVVNGTLRPADRDYYKVYGKAGERRVFEVEARRMGSAVDPALRIYDSNGKLLARVDDTAGLGVDCRLEFTFPREGEYFIEVHDARFSEQTVNFYRLKMGAYPYAEAMFPSGWTRGQPVEVELSGGNLKAPVKAKVDWAGGGWGSVQLPQPTASLPWIFAGSELPEMLEPPGAGPHPLPLGTVVNGRILKAREVDRYRVAVKPGASYLVELDGRGLGTSRLDALVTVFDGKGRRIDSAGDTPPKQAVNAFIVAGDLSRDPFLIFQAPKDAREVAITVEDLNQEGGPEYAYRLAARQQAPDFELTLATPYLNIPAGGTAVVAVTVERRGFYGDVKLKAANLPEGVEAAGGSVPAEIPDTDTRVVSRRGVITLTAKPGAAARAIELSVWGEAALPDGTIIRRKASGPGMVTAIRGNLGFVDVGRRNIRAFQAPWLGLELPAMVGYEPAGVLEVKSPPRVRIIQGMKHEFAWSFSGRQAGVRPPDAVATDTPGGRDLRITDRDARRRAGSGMLTMNTTIGTPPGTFDVILSARAGMGMQEEIVYAPAVTVEVVQGYAVEPPKQASTLARGGKTELVGTVMREEGFAAEVTIAPDALPLGVTCHPAEVAANASQYRIACEATGEAPSGEHKILLNPSSILPEGEKGKVPYKIAPVEATLLIKG
ncbi:MAG: PPC domain-containing protein [Acidobacteria bacterium]|nr:PPC domain-containing protein [Acidobacteriota bacterium]